jgi:N-acetylglucosamine kinase-like BadF-type ATPase
MAYYLGLDAGGTKTECALASEDKIFAHAAGGTIKILRASTEEAEKNLDALLQTISNQSGIPLDAIACTCIGLAGSSVPRIADWARQALHARVGGEVLVANDAEIALDAAFPGSAGILVVAGTGSNLIGRSTTGQLIRVGGWGPVLADEGSGSWIGKQAVRAIFDAQDRNETTLLLQKVLDFWNLPDIGALIDLANQLPGPHFSKLTHLVTECAEEKDLYASRILQQAGNALGLYAVLTTQRVRAAEADHQNCLGIAFTGSILQELPGIQIQMEAVNPLQGALWRARQHSKTNRSQQQAL